MSSFESKAINFMTNGPIRVRDLSELGLIPTGQTAFPTQFHEMGWASWLPMPCIMLLPFFSDGIAKGLNGEELLCYLKGKVRPDTFLLNDQELGAASSKLNEDTLLIERENRVKERLELNGFRYPLRVEDVVGLYLEVGLSTKIIEQTCGAISYDLVIRPLSHVDSILLLK
ncbi:hypothetical protein RAC89_08535 [Paenibacillus sp. GD4]|uniref:hypothetical protein n=1 Tax=Paenibacillus sp. GD4 TaxID=3068890 RepID=UPI0027969E28|nr:hypothetical protein [Paenibacillus sp. GD4]MDQ1910546.1 hypothetical protein [Paenibacillus sp. GD4]